MCDREYPRSSLTLVRSESRRGLPDLEEDLLQHLLALRAIDENAQDQAEGARREHVVEAGECGLIAVRDAEQQLAGVVDRVGAVLGHVHAIDHHVHPACPSTARASARDAMV